MNNLDNREENPSKARAVYRLETFSWTLGATNECFST